MLANKIILITGAGDGIGRQAALSYAENGATIILLGRTVKKLEAVYDEIVKLGAPTPAIFPMDLLKASPEQYLQLAQGIEEKYGRLDGLLHNAGMLGDLTPIEQYKVEEWFQVMQTNLNAPFILTQVLLPLMKKSPCASLLFTSSGVGRKGRALWGAYAVSKFGTEGLMQVLADELNSSSVRVNCVNPGATNTRMRSKAYPAEDRNKIAKPIDLMQSYLYLMSDESRHINGQSLDAQADIAGAILA